MSEDITLLKQRIDELEDINRLALTLGSTINVDEILSAIIDSSLKLCLAERAAILLFSPSSNEVVKTLMRNSNRSCEGIDHKLNLIVAGRIERSGKPLITDDIIKETGYKNPSARLQEFGPALAVPLLAEGKTIGIIHLVNSRGGVQFSKDLVRIAGVIATLAAQFIHRAKLQEALFEDNRRLKEELLRNQGTQAIKGQSPAIQEILKKINILSSSPATVLLTGETGTGKELVARAIHFQSPRAEKPFIALNCAAIPAALFESELFGHVRGAFTGAADEQKGKFELAHRGTLFLDEISEMPSDLQPKLLRVLEERKFYRVGSSTEVGVDIRIIAASSKDLNKAVERNEFREALFHRLNVLPIHLPALRDRPDDIPLLAQAFIEEFSLGTKQFAQETLEFLRGLEWKGNVRELRNTVERISIFVTSKEISVNDLRELGISQALKIPSDISANPADAIALTLQGLSLANESKTDLIEVAEKSLVQFAMQSAKGNAALAARLLGIDDKALRRRIDKYKL